MKWQRVLWKKQPFQDNYVGRFSLNRVKKERSEITLFNAFYGATAVSQEICSSLALAAVYFGVKERALDPRCVLIVNTALVLIGYLIVNFLSKICSSARSDVKLVLFYLALILCASPVIKTLTGSVSTDSINACAVALLVLRLVHHDYGVEMAIVNPSISHNMGLFAAVCLASRLSSDSEVFTLTTCAVTLFTLFPGLRKQVKMEFGRSFDIFLTMIYIIVCGIMLWFWAWHLCLWMALGLIVCNVAVPAMFVALQHHKENIYGPWDEAPLDGKLRHQDAT